VANLISLQKEIEAPWARKSSGNIETGTRIITRSMVDYNAGQKGPHWETLPLLYILHKADKK
jgi:hypothetical protein